MNKYTRNILIIWNTGDTTDVFYITGVKLELLTRLVALDGIYASDGLEDAGGAAEDTWEEVYLKVNSPKDIPEDVNLGFSQAVIDRTTKGEWCHCKVSNGNTPDMADYVVHTGMEP